MPKVYPANPYRPGTLGSFGTATRMLIQQSEFPDTYDDRDIHIIADSDRLMSGDPTTSETFKRHTGFEEQALELWLRTKPSHGKVIAFLKDALKADRKIPWSGYRIMGGVHRGKGQNVWTFELFCKHPDSNTIVYSGLAAPNVKRD